MTSQDAPGRLYTVEEFIALPEDTSARYELQEGRLLVSPRPLHPHILALSELGLQLGPQLPKHLRAMPEADVVLDGLPATVRAPDMAVVPRSVLKVRGVLSSSDVLLAVEIRSPSSIRTDTVVKLMEYADAGIPHYWVVDPVPPVTATVYRPVDGHYEESLRAEGVFEVDEPCPLRINLDELTDEELS